MHTADRMILARPPTVSPSSASFFLDLDGTLAAFEMDPGAVGPNPRRTRILTQLGAAAGERLAIVSGRTIADIDRILEGSVISAAGVHGLQRRTAHRRFDVEPHGAVAKAHDTLLGFIPRYPGIGVEMKALSVVLHYRARPDLAAALAIAAADLCRATGLVLQPGNRVFELKTPGPDKGDAVRAFMAEPPFRGFRPIYLGDDLADERGFLAAAAMGGFGVLVGEERRTAAHYRLEGVDQVLDWLDQLTGCGAEKVLEAVHG